MRKRRIFKLKRTKRRFIIRRRSSRTSQKPEVKYFRHTTSSNGSPTTVLNQKLPGSQVLNNNTTLFNANGFGMIWPIVQGTDQGQRVGNKIFVKFISIKGQAWICPASDSGFNYSAVPVRFVVSTAPVYFGGPNMPNFFASLQENKTLDWINRSAYNVHLDKTLMIKCNDYFIQGQTKSHRTPGLVKFRYKIPVNRVIEFSNKTTAGTQDLKNIEQDVYSLNVLGYNPGADPGTQLACLSICSTIYYTDA